MHAELRTRLTAFSSAVEASCAQGFTDLPKHAEDLTAGVLRELLGYRNIRNLNVAGQVQFPGIDLADDEAKVGFQVTASSSLEKIKDTLATVLRHRLQERYPSIKIIVLGRKQASYSQAAIDSIIGSSLSFQAGRDILDAADLLQAAAHASPVSLRRVLDILDLYERGAGLEASALDFDPPKVEERVELNMLELYFPPKLWTADLIERPKGRNPRKSFREEAKKIGKVPPSDVEVYEGKLLTFHDLDVPNTPFDGLFDRGTRTPLESRAFARIDVDHERVFKSLLRFALQTQLYRQHVQWLHEEKLFAFMPTSDDKWDRKEQWTDKVKRTRTVVLYRVSKKDPNKGGFRHLAFDADFVEVGGDWFMAIRPDWYFSTNPNFRPSPIGPELLKGIKRMETNKSVEQHFRFLCSWLRSVTESDLISQKTGFLSFGEIRTFDTHPALDDLRWLPSSDTDGPAADLRGFEDLLADL